jgi:hypothetical protein|nr:MAG TPA: hypothetical protein [Caudoviricetes sp.]
MKGDFIKLYRQLTNWEWYIDIPCKVLFLHCLLKANFTAGKFEGREIPAGSFVTSYSHLAKETGLTLKQVRLAINKLKRTKEVAHSAHSCYSIITVKNWDKFQIKGKEEGSQRARGGQQYKKERIEEISKLISSNKEPAEKKIEIESWVRLIDRWLGYKTSKKQSYKSESSVIAFIHKLIKYSEGDLGKADCIIENSMANNWNGIFELKNNTISANFKNKDKLSIEVQERQRKAVKEAFASLEALDE